MVDIAAALSSYSSIKMVLDGLAKVGKDYSEATLKGQVVDALEALSGVRLALIEAQDHLLEQDREIARLKAAFTEQAATVEIDGYKYRKDAEDHPAGLPYCPGCMAQGKISQLVQDGPSDRAQCPVCEKQFHPVKSFVTVGTEVTTVRELELRRQNAAIADAAKGANGWMV